MSAISRHATGLWRDRLRWAAWHWLLVLSIAVGGCKSQPQGDNASRPAATPTYQELAAAHNRRVELLSRVYADGVIEIEWEDRDGQHHEQGDMELWIALPRNTALRVEKLGEVLLWLGSNQEHWWLFDMVSKEKVLMVGRHNQPVQAGE